MEDAALTAVSGLVGVVVGGFLNAWATTRSTTRSRARTAARMALDGLDRWLVAIDYLATAATRLKDRGDDYDAYLAVELNALHRHLDLDWWETNKAALLALAGDDEARALSAAARAADGILMQLSQVGDAGRQALRKRARARREVAEKRASSEHRTGLPSPAAPVSDDPEDAAFEKQEAEMDARERELDEKLRQSELELLRLEGDLSSRLDHRLWMVRDIRASILGVRDKFEDAAQACAHIGRRAGLDAPRAGSLEA